MIEMIKNKKKVVIYGNGSVARAAILLIKDDPDQFRKIIGCAVTYKKPFDEDIEGVAVKSIDYYEKTEEEAFFLIAAKDLYVDSIEMELKKRNLNDYGVFSYRETIEILEEKWKVRYPKGSELFLRHLDHSVISDEEYLVFLSKQLKFAQFNFEINLADHCNLNCQSCNHFSPLAEKCFVDPTELAKDLERLQMLLGDMTGRIMLLGGEPLLHPHIVDVMEIVRSHMPRFAIDVVTNGVLLPKMKGTFWEALKKLNIGLSVTKYPIEVDYQHCEELARKYQVFYSYGVNPEPVKTTYIMPIKDEAVFDPYQMFIKCAHANFCIVLKKGRLYNCSFPPNIHYYNRFFGKNIPCGEQTSINIYEVKSWEEVDDYLKQPNQMCSHCDICGYIYDIPWKTSRREVSEWEGTVSN